MKNIYKFLVLSVFLFFIPFQQIIPGSGTEKNTGTNISSAKTKNNSLNKTQSLAPCGDLLVPFNNGTGWTKVNNFYSYSTNSMTNDKGYRATTNAFIMLPFLYEFCGNTNEYAVNISSNGTISIDGAFDYLVGEFYPDQFFYLGDRFKIIAGFWSDVDLNVHGNVYYKSEAHRFTVLYYQVGQHGQTPDKLNTFEIILTDGTDPIIGVGNNLGFSYGDMQWTSARLTSTSEKSEIGVQCGRNGYTRIASFQNENSDEFNGGWDDSGLKWLSYRNTSCNGLDHNLNMDISLLSLSYNGLPRDSSVVEATDLQVSWITDVLTNVSIDFSSDGGNSWSPWAENVFTDGAGEYDLICPSVNSNKCYMKLYYSDSPDKFVISGPFTISKLFKVITPQNGDLYTVNSVKQIAWTMSREIGEARGRDRNNDPLANNYLSKVDSASDPHLSVRLDYSTNDGADWICVNDSIPILMGVSNYVYNWIVPQTPSEKCKVHVKLNVPDGEGLPFDIYSESDGNFSIVNPVQINGQITLTTPNGGETYTGGSYNYISWRRTGLVPGSQSLELSTDGGSTWNKISSVPIAGVMRYSWLAPKINANKCLVRICNAITGKEYDRSNSYFSIVTPTLIKNYPNPFNPTTKISFSLEKQGYTTLRVYNTIGQQVAELVNRELKAGMYEYEFNAQNLPSGVYLYNLTVDGKSQINKMMLLK